MHINPIYNKATFKNSTLGEVKISKSNWRLPSEEQEPHDDPLHKRQDGRTNRMVLS